MATAMGTGKTDTIHSRERFTVGRQNVTVLVPPLPSSPHSFWTFGKKSALTHFILLGIIFHQLEAAQLCENLSLYSEWLALASGLEAGASRGIELTRTLLANLTLFPVVENAGTKSS
jgi:hypothetical protein